MKTFLLSLWLDEARFIVELRDGAGQGAPVILSTSGRGTTLAAVLVIIAAPAGEKNPKPPQ